MKTVTKMVKEFTEGDYFRLTIGTNNTFKLLSKEAMPGVAEVECAGEVTELDNWMLAVPVTGFELYLLQGGRDWD